MMGRLQSLTRGLSLLALDKIFESGVWMSTVVVENGMAQVWPVAERTFCSEALAFVPARRSDVCAKKDGSRKGGVWFKSREALLWYPFAVSWLCAPGSVDRRLEFPAKCKLGAGLGLRNRRNACFLNATVQALCYLPPFFSSAHKHRHARHCVRRQRGLYCGFCEFDTHIRTVTTPRSVVSKAFRLDAADIKFYPRLHAEMLHRFDISTHRQACAYEALTMLLEWLRKYDLPPELETRFLKHSIPYPQLNTAFLGQVLGSVLEHRRTCLSCREETIVHEVVNDYVLSLNGTKTLEQALSRHFAPETLDDANKSDCDKCKSKQRKRLEKRILVPPNVLVLVVKRSLWTPQVSLISGFHGLTKDNRTLQVPTTLDIAPLMTFSAGGGKAISPSAPDASAASASEGSYSQIEHKYQISSAVVHHGVPMAGHYVAICRSPSGQYFKYNDESVTPVHEERLSKELSKAYIYFYTRVSGGTPLPSKHHVSNSTDAALSKLNPEDETKKNLSLIVSVAASPSPATAQNLANRLSLAVPIPDNLSDAATQSPSAASSEASSSSPEVELEEEASTATSSGGTRTPLTGGSPLSSSYSAEMGDGDLSPSAANFTPRSQGSRTPHKKTRILRDNIARFFRSSSSFLQQDKHKHSIFKDVARGDDDQSIPLLPGSTKVASQWDNETLRDIGADLKKFNESLQTDNKASNKIPGNKRQQHDLEYDKGRSKKKKKTASESPFPDSRVFDRIQREVVGRDS
eukprot:Gregarina_sp_Pseudo_9__5229@NODE_586_length_2544_cov_16_241118_g553_i0_p1_GENE_NODE_586_length_2544_cov_16_241118_g553_i0NODE_586_length_2544_cov_16_241118_g553_i0_p1_ORF_typecomplete_len746_score125_61UCH/PF00443_29/1e42UCH/PF00443_29/2_9e03UCH_1/PF13423_6/4_8e15OSD/PF03392_13/0_073_NODE_586_length_2544_cov_16_241118_g553_i0612298